MNFIKQTILHDPENGAVGNCFAAFLSSILDIPITDIPHFVEIHGDDWMVGLNEWLLPHNLCFLTISADSEWLNKIGVKGLYHELAGKSPRHKGEYHATVGLDGLLLHDPHPSGGGLAGDESLGVFVVLEPWRFVTTKHDGGDK